jgi:uncharacterized protein
MQATKKYKHWLRFRHIGFAIIFLKIILITYLLITLIPNRAALAFSIDAVFVKFILFGFVAQLIDGTIGLGYGVSCSTLLLNFGIAPRIVTAAVHTAEVFTTGVSGLSHLRFKNIDKDLFLRIVITGVIGTLIGSYMISNVLDGKVVKPFIAGYLLLMGIFILIKGVNKNHKAFTRVKRAETLAFAGGFLDAVGGGGWGPIVTSNIIHQGNNPRQTIGTVNTAEFFIAFFSSAVFIYYVGIESWKVVTGLIAGGVLAAPVGAFFVSIFDRRLLAILIGIAIVLTSMFTIYKAI